MKFVKHGLCIVIGIYLSQYLEFMLYADMMYHQLFSSAYSHDFYSFRFRLEINRLQSSVLHIHHPPLSPLKLLTVNS